jgi:hypothetical protein
MYCFKNAQLPKKSGSRTFECEGRGANWLRGDSLWSLSSGFLLFQNIYIGLNPVISSLIESATDCIWKQCRSIYVLHSYIRQIQNKSSKLHRSKKKKIVYLIYVLFDFILPIFVPAKFVYGIRSIHFYRQFRLFFSKRLLWCIVARIWYGRVCQLLAVGRCFTPTTPPLKQTIIYIAIVCQKWCLTTNQSINLPDALIEKCVGENFVHVQLSQIIFMKNSQPRHFVSKNKSPWK